jgi:hypothetical protein
MPVTAGRLRPALLLGLFLVAVGFGLAIVQPFTTASIGRDGAAPIIHFERIAAGLRLETYLGITPKPLITFINGPVYAATHDWRPVAWVEIVAYALSVVVGAALAARVAGLASAAFVALAFLVSPVLLQEIAFVHAVPWALLAWLLAGLAVTRERPRYGLAGIALMAGTLARLETILVVVLALGVLLGLEVLARLRNRTRPPAGAYLVLLGFLAIPVMMVHDWLLVGDPFLWASIAKINSDIAGTAQGPLWVTAWLARHMLELGPVVALAAFGVVVLVKRRRWPLIVGLVALVPGTAAFLVFMAARGIFFSARYVAAIDLGLLFVAGVGLAALDAPVVRQWLHRRFHVRRPPPMMAVAAGLAVALLCVPIGPLDPMVRQTIRKQAKLLSNEQQAVAVIRAALGSTPRWWEPAANEPGAPPKVLVPARVREQMVVDLDLGLTQIMRTTARLLDPTAGRLVPGQILYHDRLDDGTGKGYEVLEIDQPTQVGPVRLVPLLADRSRGIWVVRVEAASEP